MSKNYQKLLALGMSGTLIFATTAPVFAEGETDTTTTEQATAESAAPAAYEKYESVYARLSADGTASDAYVVNHFSVDKAVPIVDYGNYTAVKNLTNLDDLTDDNGKVMLDPEQGEFYYQGTLENPQLPWLFSITYKLDGQPISAEELGGKSGKLEIHFTATKNPNADPSFYDNYVNQISLTLDSDKAKNIKAAGATAADAGASRQLTFTMLPGTDADYTITADVTDFSMSGFSIAAVPYSMDIDTDQFNMDDFTGQLDELTDAVDKLSSGTADLASGAADLAGGTGDLASGSADLAGGTADLAKGVGDLQDGGYSLLDGSAKIQNGLKEIGGKSGTIVDASAKIRDALNTISNQLGSADFSGLTSLKQLPDGLNQLAGALDQIQGGLGELYKGYAVAYNTLDGQMEDARKNMPSQGDMAVLGTVINLYDPALLTQQKTETTSQQTVEESTPTDSVVISDDTSTPVEAAPAGEDTASAEENPVSTEEIPAAEENTVPADNDTTAENGEEATRAHGQPEPEQPQQPLPTQEQAQAAFAKIQQSYIDLQYLVGAYYGSDGQGVKTALQSVLVVLNPDATSPAADKSLYLAIGTVSDNIKKISGSMGQLTQTDIEGQMNQLSAGLRQLADNYGEFHNGLVAYTDGINTLSGSYGDYQDGLTTFVTGVGDLHDGANKLSDGAYQLSDGVNQLSDGAYQLSDGANDLSDGMYEFADGISDMPNQIQDTIDDMMAQYSSSDYDAISFVDSRNANMASVQFVISTDGVEEPAAETVEETETQQGFFDRLKSLFIK